MAAFGTWKLSEERKETETRARENGTVYQKRFVASRTYTIASAATDTLSEPTKPAKLSGYFDWILVGGPTFTKSASGAFKTWTVTWRCYTNWLSAWSGDPS